VSDLASRLLPDVRRYLEETAGLTVADLALLAFGEYNVNYLGTINGQPAVVRLSTGAQEIDTGNAPILYEARALELLAPTGIAPRLVMVDPAPAGLPYGLLVEEYLPGRPLDYASAVDIAAAAGALASLHAFRPPATEETHLASIERPLSTGLVLGQGMLREYRASPLADPAVLAVFARVEEALRRLAARREDAFLPQERCIVHTDVQAHNFVVGVAGARLVDWEKPVWDDCTYDLCHFLARTSTRWKCGVDLTPEQCQVFLAAYRRAREERGSPVRDGLEDRVALRQVFVYWRAMTWCTMAWVEYQAPDRPIRNVDTFARIEEFLEPYFLEDLFRPTLDGRLDA
jgi:thiamine kinase-like enzyme